MQPTCNPTCNQMRYLPHHPVQHKQKKKIRRVTNAASIYKGHSLNKALLIGPDLLCSLVGLLLRFRQFAIAVTGDIEAMFMQIAVRKEDQDGLRFLWYKNNTETIYSNLVHFACPRVVSMYFENVPSIITTYHPKPVNQK